MCSGGGPPGTGGAVVGHPHPARLGTCAEVISMWLCFPNCILLLCSASPAHTRLADVAREPRTHSATPEGWSLVQPPSLAPTLPGCPAVCPCLGGHSWAGCRASLGLAAARLDWAGGPGRPSAGLCVLLCMWGVRGCLPRHCALLCTLAHDLQGSWGTRITRPHRCSLACACLAALALGVCTRVCMIVSGVHACAECVHVCRSSVCGVCVVSGEYVCVCVCRFAPGENVCPYVGYTCL